MEAIMWYCSEKTKSLELRYIKLRVHRGCMLGLLLVDSDHLRTHLRESLDDSSVSWFGVEVGIE